MSSNHLKNELADHIYQYLRHEAEQSDIPETVRENLNTAVGSIEQAYKLKQDEYPNDELLRIFTRHKEIVIHDSESSTDSIPGSNVISLYNSCSPPGQQQQQQQQQPQTQQPQTQQPQTQQPQTQQPQTQPQQHANQTIVIDDDSSESPSLSLSPFSPPHPSSSQPFASFRSGSLKRSSLESNLSTPSPPVAKKLDKNEAKKLERQAREEARKLKAQEKEREKLLNQANKANAANKALENCTTNISSNILRIINDIDALCIKTLFDESMVKYNVTEYVKIENSIMWTLKRTELVDGEFVVSFKDSNWVLIVMEGKEYLDKILTYRRDPDHKESIKTYLSDIRRRSTMDVILFVFGLANHLKKEKTKEANNYRKAFKNRFENQRDEQPEDATSSLSIGETELQDLRLAMEMEFKNQYKNWKLHIEFYEKTNELVQSLVRYSVSIAKLEVKLKVRASTGLDWAISMDKGRAVDPTKSSEDLKNLWIAQLQFSQVTLPTAKAITNEYPSPFALLDQYKNLSRSESENLLAELYVQKNLKRQIGASLSKRIHCFMTCQNPDTHIGYS